MHYKLETRQLILCSLDHHLQDDAGALLSSWGPCSVLTGKYLSLGRGGRNVNLELRWILTFVLAIYLHVALHMNRTVLQFITVYTAAIFIVLLLHSCRMLIIPPCLEVFLLNFIFGG